MNAASMYKTVWPAALVNNRTPFVLTKKKDEPNERVARLAFPGECGKL
jgi:hypothetical protein